LTSFPGGPWRGVELNSRLRPNYYRSSSAVLFAVLGKSSAVLTETIWALAGERPIVIPERVVAITTKVGRRRLKRILFDQGGWRRFLKSLNTEGIEVNQRLRFGMAGDHVRLIPREDGSGDLEDLATAADSRAAADFIMRALREFTDDSSTSVIASIAGGRKTMRRSWPLDRLPFAGQQPERRQAYPPISACQRFGARIADRPNNRIRQDSQQQARPAEALGQPPGIG